jgi:hypothetical protein
MNFYFVAAASLAFVVGLVHSVLGEVMIFKRLREERLEPTTGGALLRESNVRILWASWHVLTVLGWSIAAILVWLSQPALRVAGQALIEQTIIVAMLASSALVLVATKGRHPGWAGLVGVAVLIWLGRAG